MMMTVSNTFRIGAVAAAFSAMAVGAAGVAAKSEPVACSAAPAVQIYGGTITNTTTVDLSAKGGTGIADASGGDDNFAMQQGEGVAAAGNGGGSNSAANGGAIATDDINSGNNAGTAISVGDTVGGTMCDGVPAVMINGGTVINTTTVNANADGGTAIADASGGSNNVAIGGGRAGNGGNSVAGSGNGGSANSAANGGAISLGAINSGSNVGNVISVGNTISGGVNPGKPGGNEIKVPGETTVIEQMPETGTGSMPARAASLAALASAAAGLIGLRRHAFFGIFGR